MSSSRSPGGAGLRIALLALLVLLPAAGVRAEEATPDERSRVRAFLGQWLAAWRAQDADAYLALYAADAQVDARDRAAHDRHKRRLFARGERPRIDVGDVEIDADTSSGVRLLRARFDQDYESPALSDFGRKELLLRDYGSQLLIARETWTASSGAIETPLGAEPAPAEPAAPPAVPLDLPPGDELLTSEPLLPPAPQGLEHPGLPPLALVDGRAVIEEIVARINGRVLTRSMLLDRIGWYQETLLNEDPPELEERLRTLPSETLDTTIDRWVLLEEAKLHSVDIEGIWRDWIAFFRRQTGAADMAELEKLLKEQGTSLANLKEQVVETEIPNMYLQQALGGRLTFAEAELQAHFEANRAKYQPPVTVSLRQILVPVAAGADAAKAEGIARTVIAELAAGRDWCELNGIYGQAGSSCDELKGMGLDDLLPELREPAAGLPLNSTSKPIRSSMGFHVLRVSERVGAEPVTFEEARTRVLEDLRAAAFERELARVIDELRAAAVIEVSERYENLLPPDAAGDGTIGKLPAEPEARDAVGEAGKKSAAGAQGGAGS